MELRVTGLYKFKVNVQRFDRLNVTRIQCSKLKKRVAKSKIMLFPSVSKY